MITNSIRNLLTEEFFEADLSYELGCLSITEEIENRIFDVIEEDKKLAKPVFLCINDGIINKLAQFISGNISRPIAIGIAGATASGKTTFTFDLIDSILNFQEKNNLKHLVTRVNSDDYYYDRSNLVEKYGCFSIFAANYDLDCPEAIELDLLRQHVQQLLDGKETYLPKYFMDGTAKRVNEYSLAKTAKIIVSEGMYNLTDKVKDVFDLRIFVSVSPEAQKHRWYERARKRDLMGDKADEVFNNAVSKAKVYVNPTMANADIVINGEAERKDYEIVANKFLDIIREISLRKDLILK